MKPPDERPALDALAGALDDVRGRLEGNPLDYPAARAGLEALQSEAEGLGRPDLSEALARLALLSEVEECLIGDEPEPARELASFLIDSLGQLADSTRTGKPDVPAAILRRSSERWNDYLGLLDPWNAPDSEPEPEPNAVAESAIDPGLLLRLLTGGSSHEPETEAEPEPEAGPERASTPWEPSSSTTLTLDPEFREAFLSEAFDLFERIEAMVVELDNDPYQTDALVELGRCFHTLKGAAGSVGLVGLSARIHALEEWLDQAKGYATSDLLDQLHAALGDLEATLIALRQGAPTRRAPERPRDRGEPLVALSSAWSPDSETEASHRVQGEDDATAHLDPTAGSIRVPTERIDDLIDLVSELIIRRGAWTAQAEAVKQLAAQGRRCRDGLRAQIDRLQDLGLARPNRGTRPGADLAAGEVAGRLRRLTEQADDLAVLGEATQAAAIPLADDGEILSRLTLQLWDALQSVRIVPARGLFQRLARVAHEAARVEGRRVSLTMTGEETGLDRAVQDKAYEPLLHIVRNAVGHGIEPADARAAAGKAPEGLIALEAVREGNTLVLSVQDDGRGLNYEAIAAQGRRAGLLGPDETLSRERLNSLVFVSGFSTRQQANAISGRGVGMDVVAQEVNRLRGTIELVSEPGRGTKISLRLPARLALEQMIVVRVDAAPFALPVSLIEHAQPFEPDQVEGQERTATVRVRGERVALIAARSALGFSTTPAASCPKLLVVRTEGEPIALLVDAIEGTRELVIKPLGSLLAGHPVLSGTSLSVTGEVILVLNPSGLSRWQREGRSSGGSTEARPEARPSARVLVVDDSISVRKVVARRLRALGVEVEEVSDGLEALGKLRSKAYRLVLTDLEMPRMDGFELLAELRRSPGLNSPPVIVSSTASDPATRRRVLDLGARAFVAKPVDPDELERAVSGLLNASGV